MSIFRQNYERLVQQLDRTHTHLSKDDIMRKAWIEYNKIVFEASSTNSLSPSSAAAGAGAGGSGSIDISSSWVLLFNEDTLADRNTYPQSIAADSSGNVYSLSIVDEPAGSVVIRKITSSGKIVWISSFYNGDGNYDTSRLRFNEVDGFLYALYEGGIQKIDPQTGEGVLEWWAVNGNNYFVSLEFLSDGRLATLSNFSSEGDSFLLVIWSEDIESGTLQIDKEHELYLFSEGGVSGVQVNADIIVVSQDNLILPLNFEMSSGGYGTCLVKWNTTDDDVIWQFNIFEDDFGGNDQDSSGIGMDELGNIYVNGYGTGLTKISSSGELVWSRSINPVLYGLGVFSNGDIYMYGDDNDSGNLILLKFSEDGEYQWAVRISSATDNLEDGGWYSDANSSVQVVDDKLYFVGISSLSGYLRELIFKTGGELITGIFSEFTFTDVTDEFSPQVVNPNNGVEPTANGFPTSYLVLYDTNSFETSTVSQEYEKINLS